MRIRTFTLFAGVLTGLAVQAHAADHRESPVLAPPTVVVAGDDTGADGRERGKVKYAWKVEEGE